MRLPFLRRRPRVEMMDPDATVEWMRSHRQQLAADVGEEAARGIIDAFLRDQKRPRRERREWLAYLFDDAPSHPTPFAMTGEESEGKTETDHRLTGLVAQKDWPGVERHLLARGTSPEAVADLIRHLIDGPSPAMDEGPK